MKLFNSKLRIWFNRLLTDNIWGTVVLFFVGMLVLGIGVLIANCFVNDPWQNIYNAFGLHKPEGEGPKRVVRLVTFLIVGFVSAVIMKGLIIALFTGGLNRIVENIKGGRVRRYSSLSGHVVILGGDGGRHAAECIAAASRGRTVLIVCSSMSPEALRAELRSELTPKEMRHVVIYARSGEMQGQLSGLCLDKASEIYLALDEEHGGGFASIQLIEEISRQVGRKPIDKFPKVGVMFTDPMSYDSYVRLQLSDTFYNTVGGGANISLRFFNYYENCVRALWAFDPDHAVDDSYRYDRLDYELMWDSDRFVHLIIIGFGHMGHAMLLEALRICHYPNYGSETRTRITVVDPQASARRRDFMVQYELERIEDVDVDFIDGTSSSPEVRAVIDAAARNARCMLTVAVCIADPDMALGVAMNLPESVHRLRRDVETKPKNADKDVLVANNSRSRVLVWQAVKSPHDKLTAACVASMPHVRFFGSLREGFNPSLLDDIVPIVINGLYCDNVFFASGNKGDRTSMRQMATELPTNIPRWEKYWFNHPNDENMTTTEMSRCASRYQADGFRSMVATLSHADVFTDSVMMEAMAEAEHRRWIAERVLAGWRPADTANGERRVDALRIHNNMVPFNELTEDDIQKDRNVVVFAEMLRMYPLAQRAWKRKQ